MTGGFEGLGASTSDVRSGAGGKPSNPLRAAAMICGVATALLGLIGGVGWFAGMPLLTGGTGRYLPIAPDTAVAILILGVMLYAVSGGFLSDRGRGIGLVPITLVLLYGFLRFAGYILGVGLLPGGLPFALTSPAALSFGRMSPITGVLLFLAGGAMMLILCRDRWTAVQDTVGVLGFLVFLAGFIGTIGYLFGTPLLYGGRIIPQAALTVMAFLLLGAGLIAAGGPGSLVMRPFTGRSVRARLLRTFLPLTALMILAQGFLQEVVTGSLALNRALWEALLTVVFVLITGAVVARASQSISRIMDAATAERRHTEAALRESTRLFQTLARMSPVGIFRTTAAGDFVYVNERWGEMAGLTAGQASGKGWIGAVHPEDREHVRGEWERCVREKAAFKMEYRLRRPEGLITWVLGQAIPETDAADGKGGHVGTVTDITPSKQMEQKIIDLALTDQLTGLYNRRGFMMLTEQQLKAAFRQRQGMILFFADLDYLKRINDTQGHEEGDRAIMGTADVLRETFRGSDVIARTGGDEFAVLAINTDGSADGLLNRLRERIAAANRRQGCRYELSLSVGVAYYDPEHPCSLDALISQADTLMYEQKKGRQSGAT